MEPLFEFERPGFSITIYPTHVDTAVGMLFKKRDSILIRSITDVGIGRTGRLRITTNDGRLREYTVGLRAKEAREAILSAL